MRKFKLSALVLGTALALGVGAGIALNAKEAVGVKADEDDTHEITDFTGAGVGTVINNGTTPDAITISDPGYTVKQIIIAWSHNKANDGITASVTVGGDSLGSGTVGGQKTTTTTTIGTGDLSLSGDINITWTNNMSGTGKGTLYVNTLTLVEGAGGQQATLTHIVVGGAMSKTEYTTAESWNSTGLSVTAYYDDESSKPVTSGINWSFEPSAPADGVNSVVATATYGGKSASSSAQGVTVTVAHAGTAADPFTVAEGIAKCVEIGNKSGGEGPWVTTGVISNVVQVLTSGFQNARVYMTEDGKTTSPSIYVYDFKYLENAGFTTETAAYIVVGAKITVTGNLMNYNGNTPEYARGGYLLSIEAPETGDVDVTFEPAITSFEIGATGTFTASSETQGVTYSWAVDNSSVLTVNSSTGAYEAMGLGVARVTVTATANDKEGYAFADITVNGNSEIGVSDANAIAATVENGKTTAYYVYVEGYVKEFGTSMKDDNPRAFDIMDLEGNSIMVYTNVDPYAGFINGLALGDYIEVKGNIQNYGGKYEITSPEKVTSHTSAVSLAFEILSETDGQCASFVDKESDYDEFKAFFEGRWEALGTKFDALTDGDILVTADAKEDGTVVEQAMARYDFLTAKYQLDNFVTGRSVASINVPVTYSVETNNNIALIVIAAVALVSVASVVTIIVIKRKSLNR